MKKLIFLFLIAYSLPSVAQKDSLQLGDRYAEDQLYMIVSYNQLFNQPAMVKGSGFSYGLSTGFMKDLILNKQGSISMALGVGYNFDLLNHGLTISEENNDITFEVDNLGATNKLLLHNLEFPFELRWRGSDAQTYKFWRVYMGVKASYNLSNNFKFTNETDSFSYRNVSSYNTWQYGLTLSVGYDVFAAHVYYGLNPILKDTSLGTADISSKIMRIGLIFYLL
ncbi:MAG: PorT family protein [Flavobacterium sp.]|jgi:hypothetical protein|nr:PorT family protein [Flavobacterium sp.]